MPAEVKLDIYRSTLTKGISSARLDRGRRLGIVRGLLNNQSDWLIAIQSAAGSQNPHPFLQGFNLPLASVTVSRFGPTKMHVVLDYFRRGVTEQPSGQLFARIRSGPSTTSVFYNQTDSFDGFGVPNGEPHFTGADNLKLEPPLAYEWTRPTLYLSVPYTLVGGSAAPSVAGLTGKVNSSPVTFSGFTFPAGSLQFTGFAEDWYETDTGQFEFVGGYNFYVAAEGWVHQIAVFNANQPNGLFGEWQIVTIPDYDFADFVGPFQA